MTLNHDAYIRIMMKVYKAMSAAWDADEALATVEEEWENDRRGLDYLDSELFKDGFFELADMWAIATSGEAYADFLWSLLSQVT